MTVYTWTGSAWLDEDTGKTGGEPGPADSIVLRAGITDDVVLGPAGSANPPQAGVASIVVDAHASADFGTFSSFDTVGYDNFNVGTMLIGGGARVALLGSIEDRPATETMHAGNVVVDAGATLDLGVAPVDGADTIVSLTNDGAVIAPRPGDLFLGGPGFVQQGLTTPGESFLHRGAGAMIDLGVIRQGSSVPAIELALDSGFAHAVQGSFTAFGDGGFTPGGFAATTLQPHQTAATAPNVGGIAVNTATLGSHVEVVRFSAGYVLTVTDRVVA